MCGQVMASITSSGPKSGSRMLEPGRARHAARHLDKHVDRQIQGLVVHQPHAGKAQHVCNLVGIDEQAGRAVRDHGADEFGHGDHGTFDMHVGIA